METVLTFLILYFLTFFFALLRETTFSMVFSLILVFLVACILVFNFKFYFLGFMILIIYLGAIAVLFLFTVMLFDRAEYKIFSLDLNRNKNFAAIIFCCFVAFLLSISFYYFLNFYNFNLDIPLYSTKANLNAIINLIFLLDNVNSNFSHSYISIFIGHARSYEVFNLYSTFSDAELIGFDLYLKYFFLLFMAGLGSLVAMVGCIIITKSSFLDKFNRKTQRIERQLSRFKI